MTWRAVRADQRAWSLLILLILLFLPQTVQAQEPDTPPDVGAGAILWGEHCLSCHGPLGKGDGPGAAELPHPVADLTDPALARERTPLENFEIIKNGRMDRFMPPWGQMLSDAQIWDLAAQVWKLGADDWQAGEMIYTVQCADCHAEEGRAENDFTALPVMIEQSQADLYTAYQQAAEPHAEVGELSEAGLWQSLAYIRTFSFALPEQNGLLTGQAINATTGQPVGNIEVTLHAVSGNSQVDSRTTQADEDGFYTFQNLATDHTLQYVVEAEYQNVRYRSPQPAIFTPDQAEVRLDLNLYETTADPAAVEISQFNGLLAFGPGAIQVIEIFIFSNAGNETYVEPDGQTFTFSLPPQATNIDFENEELFVETETGYGYTAPIPPGEDSRSVIVTYDIPSADDALTIEIPLPADIATANMLVQNAGADFNSDQLRFVESREAHGSSFDIYAGSSLKAGQKLTLQLTGLDSLDFGEAGGGMMPGGAPAPATPMMDQTLLGQIIIIAGGVLILLVAAVYPQWRPAHLQAEAEEPEARRERLLLTLARLDQMHEAGELAEPVYRQARARYKTELAELLADD